VPVYHELRATPDTCFWGFFDHARPPVLEVRSGDLVRVETLTHQAGDAPDLLMDAGVEAVYRGIPMAERGPGVHIMTGPIRVAEANPGDTLEVRLLAMEPRLPHGTNIAAWWGYLYDDFRKERITIYRIDAPAGLARAAFAFDNTTTPRYDQPGIVVPPDTAARQPALPNVAVPLRPHLGVAGVAPREAGRINSIPPGPFGGNVDNWRFGPGTTMYYPCSIRARCVISAIRTWPKATRSFRARRSKRRPTSSSSYACGSIFRSPARCSKRRRTGSRTASTRTSIAP